LGLIISNPAQAIVTNPGGGIWDYGVDYNWIWQTSQYSNFWHPNWHRSSAMQDNAYVYSTGIKLFPNSNTRWTAHNTWANAKTSYKYADSHRSYYDYLSY
jgi:hypothetical protein